MALPAGQKIAVAATGLTVAKLRTAKRMLDEKEVDPEEPRYFACTAEQIDNLLGDVQVTSSDYNTVKALVEGNVDTYLGFKFVRTERLSKTATDRFCLAYAQSGLLLAVNKDINGQVAPRPDKSFSMYAYACLTAGATRMEEEKVVEVACLDPGDYGGLSRHDYDEITTDGTETTGDRLFCGKLMPGERFHEAIVVFGALGAGRTLQLGDAADDDRYMPATSVAAAGNAEARAATGFGFKNNTLQSIDLFLQVAGGALTAAQQVKLIIRKSRD